jgi:hypothetical protein
LAIPGVEPTDWIRLAFFGAILAFHGMN